MQLHWHILDKKRRAVLPLLKSVSEDGFYLAGGTGLALQLGHRDSVDFDFFKKDDFDTRELIEKIESVFKGHRITITGEKKNTIHCEIDGNILLTFLGTPYKWLQAPVKTEYFDIASIEDIACMKALAITQRIAEKDYVDLYFILHKISFRDLLHFCTQKYTSYDEVFFAKNITFLDDVETKEPVKFKEGYKVTLKEMKKYFQNLRKEYQRQLELESIRKQNQVKGKDLER